MNEHQSEEWPERPRERQQENRGSANEVAEGEEFLRGKMTVRVLVAEEHADDGGDGEGVENPRLLYGAKLETGQVAVDQRQPASPNEELQHHHQEEFETNRVIHSSVAGEHKSKRDGEASVVKSFAGALVWPSTLGPRSGIVKSCEPRLKICRR